MRRFAEESRRHEKYGRLSTVVFPLAVCVAILVSGTVFAQDEQNEFISGRKYIAEYQDKFPGLTNDFSFSSLQPLPVAGVVELLANKAGISIVIDNRVEGTTKFTVKGVTVGEAMEIIMAANDLAYELKGDILTVMRDLEYAQLHGEKFYDRKRMKLIDLKFAKPSRLVAMLEGVKSKIGSAVADDLTGTLILIDTPEKIREMEEIIKKAEIPTVVREMPTETRAFVLQYADVDEIAPQVEKALTLAKQEAGASMQSDKRTRTLLVTALPHDLAKVATLIAEFDKPSKEVFIEAKIVQVNLTDDFRLGIDWQHVLTTVESRQRLNTHVNPPIVGLRGGVVAPGSASGAATLTYRTILGGGDLTAIINALKSVGETKVISDPHVAVLDGEEAVIKVIREEPYAEAQIESGTTNVIGETFRFIEVGVKLSVTPRINDEGFITVGIQPEVSTVEGQYQARFTVPIVQKSYAQTTVKVKDGETIIIAGMIEDMKGTRETRVPIIGSLPLIGALFRSETEFVQTRETIVFLTPRIITGEEPFLRSKDIKKNPKPLRRTSSPTDKAPKPMR